MIFDKNTLFNEEFWLLKEIGIRVKCYSSCTIVWNGLKTKDKNFKLWKVVSTAQAI